MNGITAENEAANKGYDAAMNGEPRENNPYPKYSKLEVWWDFGWLEFEDNDTIEVDTKKED